MSSFSEHVFEFGGVREMVDAVRAVELLSTVSHISNPSILRLSNKSFSIDAAKCIADTIASFDGLTHVDISDIIAGRPEEEALLVLKTLTTAMADRKLIEVNVSDNAFGLKGIHACRDILTSNITENFYFCNNGLSAEAVEQLAEILLASGETPPIRVLHFYNNMCGNGGAIAMSRIISACVNLEDLRFSATRSMAEGCAAIAAAVDSVCMLKKLDLSDNNFGDSAGVTLARALSHQPQLNTLNLRDSGLSEAALKALFSTLSSRNHECQLRTLDLSGNDISSDLVSGLLQALEFTVNLEELLLDDNDIESEGATLLAEGLSAMRKIRRGAALNLRMLSVCTCSITAYGALKLARSVAKLSKFSSLNIDGNQIFEDTIPLITDILTGAGKTIGSLEDNDGDDDDDAGSAADEDENESAEESADVAVAVAELTEGLEKAAI